MTVGNYNSQTLVDTRFGDGPRYHLTEPKDINMRVPDQIRDCVLFVGTADIDYRGTAFIVTVPGTRNNDFAFMVTARHVAEAVQGEHFYIRANTKRGAAVDIKGAPDNPWWFHPTERDHVDAAVTLFAPYRLAELDVQSIPIAMFADDQKIKEANIGIGDEIFITGLFTKVRDTARNIPIVRTGTVAMMPGERIPFTDGKLIEAYLVESRSIGGLSGSPVFVRETLQISVLPERYKPRFPSLSVPSSTQDFILRRYAQEMQGTGRFYLFGSVIGHWDALATSASQVSAEAVNMGIAPVVPAHKIKEIIMQPEIVEMMKKIDEEMHAQNQMGATLDFAKQEKAIFTQDDFDAALKKVTRKKSDET